MADLNSLADFADTAVCPRLVIKVGSSLLVGADGEPRRNWLRSLAQEIGEHHARGQEVVIVSSGAVALGAARIGAGRGERVSLADKQAAAAVGQIVLAGLWADVLGEQGLAAAQILLTLRELENRREYLNASATLSRLLQAGAVPVVNENDSVATSEIRFGDNDRLAARVANAARADAVMLLSDVDGLYDSDPACKDAQLLEIVPRITPDIVRAASAASSSGMGSGGMASKIKAAEIAQRAGIALAIINGKHERPISRAIAAQRGTFFVPRRSKSARKAWLGGRLSLRGTLTVDQGAAEAIRAGASLLGAGMTGAEGGFKRGNAVAIATEVGETLAHGLVEYDAEECCALIGLKNAEQEAVLGYPPRSAVVHRNHMVLL